MEPISLNSLQPKSQLMWESQKVNQEEAPVNELMESFAGLFERQISKVDSHLKESDELTRKLASGEIQDVHSVMIATQKAQVALSFTIALRDKMITAYTDILAMGR